MLDIDKGGRGALVVDCWLVTIVHLVSETLLRIVTITTPNRRLGESTKHNHLRCELYFLGQTDDHDVDRPQPGVDIKS